MPDAYLCLGSNAPSAGSYLTAAMNRLGSLPQCKLLASSSIYLTEPQNFRDQPWFHNQIVKLDSGVWTPEDLLRTTLTIEKELGRTRNGPRFGPRAIDIDLLLFGDLVSINPFCILPHPRMLERAFALVPLIELEPEICILGTKASIWLSKLVWRREGRRIFQ